MVWTGQTFSVGQILTAAQMTNLQNDISAAFAKDAGAPVLANNYVVNAMIATDAVNADSIAAGAVGASEIAANAVGASEIATGAVGSDEIAANAVGASEIAAGAVDTSELASAAVETAKIADANVTLAKLATNLKLWDEIDSASVGSGTNATLDGMDSTYDVYMVIGYDIQRAGSISALRARVRIASSTQTGTSYIQDGAGATSSIDLGNLSNTTTDSTDFTLFITAPSNTGIYKPIRFETFQGTDATLVTGAARWEGSTSAINGLYFYPTSGPFQGGEFILYGLRK